MPRALQRFCTARLVSRVAGMHLNSTLGTQVMWRDGPMTEGEISPRARPGLSPLVMGIVVSRRSEEHTSELQSLMRISYAVFCLKKKTKYENTDKINNDY